MDRIAEEAQRVVGELWVIHDNGSYAGAIHRESEAERVVCELLRRAAAVAVANDIAHFGDGHGGVWLTELYRALVAAGMAPIPATERSSPAGRAAIPSSVRTMVYERDKYRCVVCGTWRNLTLDHIVPWSLTQDDRPANLQTMCGPCNSRKGDRT